MKQKKTGFEWNEKIQELTRNNATDHIEDVRGMVFAFRRKGQAAFCTCNEDRYNELSSKPNLFETTVLYTQPADCPRCADYVRYCPECGTVGEVAQTFRDCCPDGSHAGYVPKHIADKLAALEAENKRLTDAGATYQKKWMDAESLLLEKSALIASQGIRAMEDADTIAQQAEQLAAAEKDVKRLNDLETLVFNGDVSIEEREPRHSEFRIHTGDTDYDKPFVGRTLREAIDAAAHRKGKS